MMTLVSATNGVEMSVKKVCDPIGLTPFKLLTAENIAQFDAIKMQQTRELPFA
jgi:hypothetical protein